MLPGVRLQAADDVLREVWQGVTSVQPLPDPTLVALTGVVAAGLVALPATWPLVRLAVTTVHEAGHAAVAVLVGRRLQGIRLHSDSSGVTVTRGRPRGPGMVATLAAGYLAPAGVGVLAALLLAAGRSVGLLWAGVLLVALLLVHVRNAYGLALLLFAGGLAVWVSWSLPPPTQSLVAHLLAWLFLLGAPRPVLELIADRRRRRPASDAHQLARLTRVPALAWMVVFLLANLTGLAIGVVTLLPELASGSG